MNYKRDRRGKMLEKIIDGAVLMTAAAVFWSQVVTAVGAPAPKLTPRPAPAYWEGKIAQMGVGPIRARKEFTWRKAE